MALLLTPSALAGEAPAIPSKSAAHRILIAAALSDAPTHVPLPSSNRDIEATLRCLAALGARYEDGWMYPLAKPSQNAVLPCGESGSTLRFLLPVVAGLGCGATFTGEGRLPQRSLGPLLGLLAAQGITLEGEKLPLRLSGLLRGGDLSIAGDVSSQFVTGLLFTLPLLTVPSALRLTTPLQSAGYVRMTLSILRDFGVEGREEDSCYRLRGTYRTPGEATVEGDWSSAASLLVCAAMGGRVTVTGLKPDSEQPDRVLLTHLSAFGASVTVTPSAVTVAAGERRPFTADVSQCPDLFPVLAVLAAAAEGDSTLTGAARLRDKESDRIAATAALLTSLGGRVTEGPDFLRIHGYGTLQGGTADGAQDHRIVMAAAAAACICRAPVLLQGEGAVGKSYPDFFRCYAALGGRPGTL